MKKPKIRLTIFSKLFLATFIGVTILAVSILVFTQWSFRTGLIDLINGREIKQAEYIAKKLEQAYVHHENWQFVSSLKQWHGFIDKAQKSIFKTEGQQGNRLKRPPPIILPFPPVPPVPPFPARMQKNGEIKDFHKPQYLKTRIQLFDPQQQLLVGDPQQPLRKTTFHTYIKLYYDGQIVGLLRVRQGKGMFSPLINTFLQQQQHNAIYIAGFSLLVALLTALILARYFIHPVKILSVGTEKLTSGHLGTRIIINSKDEFSDLAHDFNQLANTLEKNETQRKQWLVDISHELRTPIAVLQSEIEALLDGIRTPTGVRIESLHHDVLSLGKLVNDLYQLSLADSNEVPLERHPVRLYDIIRVAANAAKALLQQKQIEIELIVPRKKDTDVLITGNKRVLNQLFSNLLENSWRYTDEQGKVEITLQVKQDVVEVLVADSAPAVPVDALPLLFERLYRVDKSRNRATGGSGLGLAICKKIVEAHQGGIQAEHTSLGGLLIRLYFPLGTLKK
jgi:two-component system sensor histidine kinase BaeS